MSIPKHTVKTFIGEEIALDAHFIAVKDGRIAYVGKEESDLEKFDGRSIDLEGKTLLPGFIDAHGHGYFTGFQAMSANLLPPPDGGVTEFSNLVNELAAWSGENQAFIDEVGWIIGFGYDDAQLAEKAHPTAEILDQVSTEKPILVIHQSGHLGAVNHKGLELLGFNAKTENPSISRYILRRVVLAFSSSTRRTVFISTCFRIVWIECTLFVAICILG